MRRSLQIRAWFLGTVILAAASILTAAQTPEPTDGDGDSRLLISPDAIEMPEDLRQILGDVTDGGSWKQKGLTDLVDHVSALEALSSEKALDLESPSYAKLLAAPRAYRGQAIRLSFVPRSVLRIEPSAPFPSQEPFWVLRGFFHEEQLEWSQPVIVVTTFDPIKVLPAPTRRREDKVGVYESPDLYRLQVVGVFFKVSQMPGEDLRTGRTVPMPPAPVVVAWQSYQKQTQARPPSYQLPVIIAGVLIAVLGFFYVARRYLRQLKHNRNRESPVQRYRRERLGRRETEDAPGPTDEDNLSVDPSLIEAASQYRKEHDVDEPDR